MNADKIKLFVAKIDEQTAEYEKLYLAAEKQFEMLENRDLKEFESAVKAQEEIIMKISVLEKEKQVIFEGLAAEAGFAKEYQCRLDDLAAGMDTASALLVRTAVEKLVEKLKKTEAMNAKNMRFVKNYVDYVNFASEKSKEAGIQGKANFDKTI